jgi:hypothetical protein
MSNTSLVGTSNDGKQSFIYKTPVGYVKLEKKGYEPFVGEYTASNGSVMSVDSSGTVTRHLPAAPVGRVACHDAPEEYTFVVPRNLTHVIVTPHYTVHMTSVPHHLVHMVGGAPIVKRSTSHIVGGAPVVRREYTDANGVYCADTQGELKVLRERLGRW